jgi:hypothetical protein
VTRASARAHYIRSFWADFGLVPVTALVVQITGSRLPAALSDRLPADRVGSPVWS